MSKLPKELTNITFSDIAPLLHDNFDLIDWDLWNNTVASHAVTNVERTLVELDALLESLKERNSLAPYDALKKQLFDDNGLTIPTLESLPVPSLQSVIQVPQLIDRHVRKINDEMIGIMTEKGDKLTVADLDFIGFKKVVNGVEQVDVDKIRCYVEMLELIHQSYEIIDDNNIQEISLKLLYKCGEYCNM